MFLLMDRSEGLTVMLIEGLAEVHVSVDGSFRRSYCHAN